MSAVGTYVGVKYTKETLQLIRNLTNTLKVPNVVARDKLHSTIIFSRKVIDIPYGAYNVNYLAWTKHLDIWQDNDKNILVLLIGSRSMRQRHYELERLGGTSDFPDFNQHITLSYDIGNWQIPFVLWEGFNISTVEEYSEELVLDWK